MRSHLRYATVIGAFALSTVAITPAMAAAPVSQSGANAVTVSVAGNGQGTGDTTAKNDGSTETKTGDATPPLSVLGGQSLINAGVLAQEATARKDSTSAACAGLAGNGGSVVAIGDSRCLNPGTPVNATLGSLDLSDLVVANPATALAPLNDVLAPVLSQLTPVLNTAVSQVRAQVGDLGLVAGFGAVEGRCTASLGSAEGDATLANAKISVELPDQAPTDSITLLNLPVNPAPNTHLATDLSGVLTAVLAALTTDLNTAIDGAGAPLNAVVDAIQENVVTAIHDQVEANLAPLEDNILDVTLNQQVRSAGAIKVRALDLSLLPVVEEQLGSPLVNLQIGNAACGPSGRVETSAPAAAPAPPKATGLPKAVSAGYATVPAEYAHRDDTPTRTIVLGAFALLVSFGAGVLTFRRLQD